MSFMTVLPFIILALTIACFLSFETKKTKINLVEVPRPLSDNECAFLISFPPFGLSFKDSDKEQPDAYYALLNMGLITENWEESYCTSNFTGEGQALDRMMRVDDNHC